MLETFISSFQAMLGLFFYMTIGFLLIKTKILPENSSKVMAKLLTFVFCPALSFTSMAKNFNVESMGKYASLIILSLIAISVSIILAIYVARFFVKDKMNYERRVYTYALTFGNYGYVGAPLVIALFGMEGYAFFNFVTLPCTIVIYTWGINTLVPKTEKKRTSKETIKSIFNVPTIALLIGMVVGITGLGKILFEYEPLDFISSSITTLGNCMAPGAMLLAGITVARYDFNKMLKNKKVYVATFLRLVIIPTIIIAVMFLVIKLANLLGLSIDYSFLFLVFFVYATPLGMNTIVFPEAFGGDASVGASMTLISHVLCVITIPLLFALLSVIFAPIPVFI